MKSFAIIAKSEKGEEILLQDLNTNKGVFNTTVVKEKPFLELSFDFRRSPAAFATKKLFNSLKEDQVKKHLGSKMQELGGEEGRDYEIRVLM